MFIELLSCYLFISDFVISSVKKKMKKKEQEEQEEQKTVSKEGGLEDVFVVSLAVNGQVGSWERIGQ